MRELQLRIFAGAAVTKSELPKAAKLQLLNFIESEATDAQIKVLIMDGEITYLDEFAEQIVHDRWEVKMLDETFAGGIARGVKSAARKMKLQKPAQALYKTKVAATGTIRGAKRGFKSGGVKRAIAGAKVGRRSAKAAMVPSAKAGKIATKARWAY